MQNKFKIEGDAVKILLEHEDGNMWTTIDLDNLPLVRALGKKLYPWFSKKSNSFYAVFDGDDGKMYFLHEFIMGITRGYKKIESARYY